MALIVMHRKRNLVVPKAVTKGERVLKLCVRCRLNKTKCDAAATSPNPCTYCSKKNYECRLDITRTAKREYDVTERLVAEVQELHDKLDCVVLKKAMLVNQILRKRMVSVTLPSPPTAHLHAVLGMPDPEVADAESIYIDPIPTLSLANSFTIHSNHNSDPCTVSYAKAQQLFKVFEEVYCVYLPVLPHSFFRKDLHEIHQENDLLFWSIIVTTLLTHGSLAEYLQLASHVQDLVVVNCWFNTPRSLYSLVALLILTTWPLRDNRALQFQDSISVKYISLMKSLALQFGLHKLNFIEEFSKKTSIDIDRKADVNNMIRERIYKYVNINSNYWLVYLGLSTSNYNGFSQDYIVNRAANIDIFNKGDFADKDNFINSLLKVSLVQLKMNENMNELTRNPSHVSKLIHLNMYEQILTGYSDKTSPLVDDNGLLSLSVEFTKLQLFIDYFSKVDISVAEFKRVVYRTLACCKRVLDLFELLFKDRKNYFLVPIHYRFSVELASLVLLEIHSSPLLYCLDHYAEVKEQFLRSYNMLTNGGSSEWDQLNLRLLMIIRKYNACDKQKLLLAKNRTGSFFLINKMSDQLVSGLHYEMVWNIYQTTKVDDSCDRSEINWELYGLSKSNLEHQKIMDYCINQGSIFS